MIKIAFFNNQGGNVRLPFYRGLACEVQRRSNNIRSTLVVWEKSEARALELQDEVDLVVFEDWMSPRPRVTSADVDTLNDRYKDVNWAEVVAAERSFTDFSLLLGAAGDRKESVSYVSGLVVRLVWFYEHLIKDLGVSVFVSPTADTLFTLVGYKVARTHGVKVISESPGWLIPNGFPGAGFFCSDEFMHCPRMQAKYLELKSRALTLSEIREAEDVEESVLSFRGKTSFSVRNKGADAGRRALTPNVKDLVTHVAKNVRLDKQIVYTKFEIAQKVRANFLRLYRKFVTKRHLESVRYANLPKKIVFFPLQYQPEQSTLTQATWFSNQIHMVECISKSLPMGYTLVVKEHPWGRGNRPLWQYKHIDRLYNVVMCDASARHIVERAHAVVALPGTVALESMILDCPTVLVGKAFFDFSSFFFKVADITQLPSVLRAILIDGQRLSKDERRLEVLRTLLAYKEALVPAFPTTDHIELYSIELIREIDLRKS